MKKYIITAYFVLISGYVLAQGYTDEMNRLIAYAADLRKPDSDDSVLDKMIDDDCWTLMDEIKSMSSDSECSLARVFEMKKKMMTFGINDLAYKAEEMTESRYTSAGNFCNGTDPRYKYSFIERTVRSEKTASFEIPQREGIQVFIIIPFFKEDILYANIRYGGEDYLSERDSNGNIVLRTGSGDGNKSEVVLSVTNSSKKDISFLIINYNSRSSEN